MTSAWWTLGAISALALVVAIVVAPATGMALTHVVGTDGWVLADPRQLAAAAGVSPNVYALASMMTSEAGDNAVLQAAVGWAAKNKAERVGVSLLRLLTRAGRNDGSGTFVAHESSGFFGPQNVGPRYASTRKAPTKAALAIAEQISNEDITDPTDGCTQFDAPSAQDSFLGRVAGYVKDAAQIAEERSKNAEIVMLPGITSTRFWRPKV